ncbi:hypothetical protein IEO21_01253 [Rhodonia placenta]|uniref:Uncharacterized protein n=1 Tax=Rhodonia placenta TaxID=104341 RepID=A0A8H7P9S4_9APHY|nr:hypothetical protein IEO21_01253 [Postia placenta]
MSEPSKNTMSGNNPMYSTSQDPTAFGYSDLGTGTRSDNTEAVSGATGSLVERPVDAGARHEYADPAPNSLAQGDGDPVGKQVRKRPRSYRAQKALWQRVMRQPSRTPGRTSASWKDN